MSVYTTVSCLFAVAWLVSQHRRFSLIGHSERQRGRQAILIGVMHLWRLPERCHVNALAQERGDTTSPVSRLQNVGQQRSVLCCIYRVISILILYYLRCWNQLYPRFRSYHTALTSRLQPSLSLPMVHTSPRWKSLIRSNWVPPFSLPYCGFLVGNLEYSQ